MEETKRCPYCGKKLKHLPRNADIVVNGWTKTRREKDDCLSRYVRTNRGRHGCLPSLPRTRGRQFCIARWWQIRLMMMERRIKQTMKMHQGRTMKVCEKKEFAVYRHCCDFYFCCFDVLAQIMDIQLRPLLERLMPS